MCFAEKMRIPYAHSRRADRSMAIWILWLLMLGYFTYHLVQGERGAIAMWRLQGQLTRSEEQLQTLRSERQSLEKHVQLLHPSHVDPDMLDEQARRSLGYAGRNEVMVLVPKDGGAVLVMPQPQ